MATYNTNSVFSVSSAGIIPNKVDDLIFFEDISYDQKPIWDEFEDLIAIGDYAGAQALAKSYGDLHGYFADLYNMMVNRLYAVQNLLAINQTNINNGTAPFNEFVKPKLARYQEEPDGITQGMVWIGPKDYFGSSTEQSTFNKLKTTVSNTTQFGVTVTSDMDGHITLNGTTTNNASIILGSVQDTSLITSGDIWTWYAFYVSGAVRNRTSGGFYFGYTRADGNGVTNNFSSSFSVNLHGNLIGIKNNSSVQVGFRSGYGETYDNLKVAFMVGRAAEASPNQKYVPYRG